MRLIRNPDQAELLSALKSGPLRVAEDCASGDFWVWPAPLWTHAEAIRRFLPATADGAGYLHDRREVMAYLKRRAGR
ncbi:hypothetical protein [Elioraea sp.]|uniref:hypothetical protein n=1 Tax=Elioraea sp. TaxID=2185103 RepID=UPI002606DF45|nr:hypothetical protein [Elioraea sp.]